LPIAGVTSQALAKKIDPTTPVEVLEKTALEALVKQLPQRIKVVLGAGDVGLELNTLKKKLEQNETV
jgi:UDP-N-acetylmuramate--alanine ligase